jgi:hypothetical protein
VKVVIDSIERIPAHDAPEVAAFRSVAADPIGFMARVERSAAGRETSQQLLADMQAGTDRIGRLLQFMVTHDPDLEWPAEQLAEARLWGDTMRRLMEQLIDLAGLTAEVER